MTPNETLVESVKSTALRLLAYCRASDWAGYDPYDALNSEVFKSLPFLNFRIARLGLTQVMKRLPFNLRPLLLVPKTQNPKGLGLFLSSCLILSKHCPLKQGRSLAADLMEKLISLRSGSNAHWCWGYSFPWQTRTLLVPRGGANLVCTTFVANAMLDAYEQLHESRCLEMAVSAAEYIRDELYWTEGKVAGFSYPLPSYRARVHNANFLGAAFLCRVYSLTHERMFLEPALNVARYSAARQQSDGSWDYGELPTQRWKDNFHTGYNLCALRAIVRYAGEPEFEPSVRRGFAFYRDSFFQGDGAAKYFHDRVYPIDIHSVAQSIITLMTLRDLHEDSVPLALSVFRWAMTHLWNERGYFYYRKHRMGTVKISYMRWSQAWMLLALSTLMDAFAHPARGNALALQEV